jgi:hypothetical protein
MTDRQPHLNSSTLSPRSTQTPTQSQNARASNNPRAVQVTLDPRLSASRQQEHGLGVRKIPASSDWQRREHARRPALPTNSSPTRDPGPFAVPT